MGGIDASGNDMEQFELEEPKTDPVNEEQNAEESQETNEELKNQEQEPVQNTEEPVKKPTIFDKIKSIIKRSPDGGGEETNEQETGEVGEQVTQEDIPDEFVQAALKAGMNEQQIKDHASGFSDEELMEQISDLLPQDQGVSEKSEASPQNESAQEKPAEEEADEKDKVIAALTERIDNLEKGRDTDIEKQSQQELQTKAGRVNRLLDKASEEFEVFGTEETLPRYPHNGQIVPSSPAAKARNEVWQLALTLEAGGMDFDTALTYSFDAYKGKNLQRTVQRNMVKDLKKSEKKISPKPSGHQSVKTGLSGPEVVRDALNKQGID